MLIATVSTIISLIFLIAFVAAMIILQVYLSRRESKLPGLVLPAITFSGGAVHPAERGDKCGDDLGG